MKFLSLIIIAVIVSIVSSFSISKIIKNVNKAASVAVVSGLIAVSPAYAENIVFDAPVSKLVIGSIGPGDIEISTDYSPGKYLKYDCPGDHAMSIITISSNIPHTILTDTIFCSTDSVKIEQPSSNSLNSFFGIKDSTVLTTTDKVLRFEYKTGQTVFISVPPPDVEK
mmetsp:Transcript_17925/g.16202  ORF Transcript_17925/g.16202 Transcript_17925/m.16202 type:complete len:168 (-) Transcript_17925:69-572(-)